jgi:hypothetical protein
LDESRGIDKLHLRNAYVRVLREREGGNIRLLNSVPIPPADQVVVFDTEYLTDSGRAEGVLYGFLDLETGELRQFWFDERSEAQKYLDTKCDKVFVFWGGADRKILHEELKIQAQTLNLLARVQTSLIAPISSTELREVHDILYGSLKEEKFWKHSFYEMDGILKGALCRRILKNPGDVEARRKLADVNKADILALQHVMEKIVQLQIGAQLSPHSPARAGEQAPQIPEHPIVTKDRFSEIIHSLMDKRRRLHKKGGPKSQSRKRKRMRRRLRVNWRG